MNPEAVKSAMEGLNTASVSVACYLPDSHLRELYQAVIEADNIRSIPVTNEGEGAAICGGVFLTGKRSVMIMENSGLRVAAEPLARMGMGHGIPVTLIMSYRGDFGERNWWGIPHAITMEPLLHTLRIPYRIVESPADVGDSIIRAVDHTYASQYHTALVLTGDAVK